MDGLFALAYVTSMVMSAVGVCWAVFAVPFPHYVTTVVTVEQVKKKYTGIDQRVYDAITYSLDYQ